MRRWRCQCLIIFALVINVVILYYFWVLQNSLEHIGGDFRNPADHFNDVGALNLGPEIAIIPRNLSQFNYLDILTAVDQNPKLEIPKYVTVIVREFEFFENDLAESIQSFLNFFPTINILVLADAFPYPPLNIPLNKSNVKLLVLRPQLDDPPQASRPETYISTPFLLFLPASVRLVSVHQLEEMLTYVITHPTHLAAAKVGKEEEKVGCQSVSVDVKRWTLERKEILGALCDSLGGGVDVVLLAKSSQCLQLTQPFARPFPDALFIQTAIKQFKVYLMDKVIFERGRSLFLDSHMEWKHVSAIKERENMLYEELGIKKVVIPSGETEWHGCSKTSARCFGTVVNDTPHYLYLKRWTPPCCLERLRETARHVFQALSQAGVRYWLEGGSLLGATRNGDIIPWDYDVDIGMYDEDVHKCEFLRDSVNQAVITDTGFVWEKAPEGDFFRVQYSQTNHLHVDIFPFQPHNGIMMRKKWSTKHKQDVDFPEHYLRPLTTIPFVGTTASAPNNIREFVELKFGEGVVDRYEFPNPKLLPFAPSFD